MKMHRVAVVLCALLGAVPAGAQEEPVVAALQEFFDFADYSGGAITPGQVDSVGPGSFFVVDTRSAARFGEGHLPGAVNIDWRQVFARRDELPRDRPVLLYCDTGLLSSKAHLALLLAGYDNARVLSGGYEGWQRR